MHTIAGQPSHSGVNETLSEAREALTVHFVPK